MRGLQSGFLDNVFFVRNINGIFRDAISKYYANAAAMSGVTPKRKGQLCYGVSGTTAAAYIAYGTAAGEWTKIPS